jgi:3-oxoacyl-[acyl-carrier-protein] synthase III
MKVLIKDVELYMPEKIVTNEFFNIPPEIENSPMFKGAVERRHSGINEKTGDLLEKATLKLISKLGLNPEKDIDLILTNAPMLDIPFTGQGALLANKIGAKVKHIYDIHNAGCISFVFMLELAKNLMKNSDLRSAIIANVATSAGKIFANEQNRNKPQSLIPGDGCGVAYIIKDNEGGEVLDTVTQCHTQFSEDMSIYRENGKQWWEVSEEMGIIEFNRSKIAKILMRGNMVVNERVNEILKRNGKTGKDIDLLITNQPNPIFLRNWRESLQIPEEKHIDTFYKFGNLFGAAVPVNLALSLSEGKIKPGDLVCLAGFSHAGDYSGAALIQY